MHILKYLSLKDQLSLFEACKEEPSSRFGNAFGNVRKALFLIFLHMDIPFFALYPELDHELLSIISPTVDAASEFYKRVPAIENHRLLGACFEKQAENKIEQLTQIFDLKYQVYIALKNNK